MLAPAMASSRPRPRSPHRTKNGECCIVSISFAFFLIYGVAGCGHPATDAECVAIVDRIVELELKAQNVTDPTDIAKRRRTSLAMIGDGGTPDLRGCVGRHITDSALTCVRSARTAEEITEQCLK